MLIDGELPEAESEKIRAHIAVCDECRNLEKDFLFFSSQIKESASDFEFEKLEPAIFAPHKQAAFWKRGIALPVPVFAGFMLFLIALSVWFVASRFYKNEGVADKNYSENSPQKTEKTADEFSLARFDKGGRAEIYIAPRGGK